MNRLLPWTGEDGRSCYLSTDGDGPLSRLADRIEFVQLGLAGRLLDHARDVLTEAGPVAASDLGVVVAQLTDALRDALLIAESRGARLAPAENERVLPNGVHAVPPLIEVAQDTLAHCPTAPKALGLLSLPGGDLASAGAARRYVRMAATSWGLPPDTADALETITGELSANALEYSASLSITVALSRTASAVVVSVTDEGQECVSVPDTPGPEQEHGRGLLIVDALASHWGRRHTCTGLTVWAEITVEG
ncbi:ATP-binding protein [Streptomyces sp. ISL-100]|uniref:ATP-binding protein n=1 Tax=Streptomyces sp. ISL-100 TaxID=2819173 RepID=UPI001BEAB4F2|nr:ATP-binding protein [Streptomyces sp. ISL-100]MBT2399716.1 ATP-binding protein [Streptomyces sp. ISL-100]